MRWFDKIADWFGDLLGDTENIVHHPLYPITPYVHHVDVHLLRGSWPDATMLGTLRTSGVVVVVNLCSERSQDHEVEAAGLVPYNIAVEDNTAPTRCDIEHFLNIVTTQTAMVYVHCEAGKGRTGVFCAAYRVRINGWTPKAALAEAEHYGLALPCQKEFILGLTGD